MGLTLGWINALVLSLVIINYALIRIKLIRKTTIGSFLNKKHSFFAYILVLFSITHSYFVWGINLSLHTGHLLFFSILMSLFFSLAGKRLKKPFLFQMHKYIAFLSIILFLLHIWKPYLCNE